MKMLLGALGYDSRHRGLHRCQLVREPSSSRPPVSAWTTATTSSSAPRP
ncbi:MAG: hypothetical protein ACLUIW_00695 [Dysosmobacter welbionis]